MKYVIFSIPATRIPLQTFGLSVADENFFKVLWESFRLKRDYMIDNCKKVDKFLIRCTSDQFAEFIILRNKYGVANWVKELDAKIEGSTAAEHTSIIDVTHGTPHMIGKKYEFDSGAWTGRQPLATGGFVDSAAERVVPKEFVNHMHFHGTVDAADVLRSKEQIEEALRRRERPLGYIPPAQPIEFSPTLTQHRDDVIEELAKIFDLRSEEAIKKAAMGTQPGERPWQAQSRARGYIATSSRHQATAKMIRCMKGDKTYVEASRDHTINFWREEKRKFYIKVDGITKVAYFVDAVPRNIVKIDGDHTYYGDHDNRLDWSTTRPAGGSF